MLRRTACLLGGIGTIYSFSNKYAFCRSTSVEEIKRKIGRQAIDDFVISDMVVGMGSGTTTYFAIERLGEKLRAGSLKNIVMIPSSV